jgi:hypothetical protein
MIENIKINVPRAFIDKFLAAKRRFNFLKRIEKLYGFQRRGDLYHVSSAIEYDDTKLTSQTPLINLS